MMQIQFSDKMVTYETFVNDIAARLFAMMAEKDDKAFISQNKAYAKYGRQNIERWRSNRLIEPRRTKGKFEYSTVELQRLANIKQDYF
jgi:hypothetical protein